LSADYQDDRQNNAHLADMRALDAALRNVLTSAPQESLPQLQDFTAQTERLGEVHVASRISQQAQGKIDPRPADRALPLDETIDVVTRAANAIDELVLRNRSVTDAAVRSVEFYRKQAAESAADAEMLREELRIVRAQAEAQLVAAEAQRLELETELAAQTADFKAECAARAAELASAQDWIDEIRSQVESLLGDAQTRLDSTSNGDMFGR
jgi:hypothetical protein